MKIDLQCHTKSIKHSEPSTRNVKTRFFKKVMQKSGMKIAAITNHNSFDKEQFKEFASATKDFMLLWPGVELDVCMDGNESVEEENSIKHLIVIYNPDKVEEFEENLKLLIGEKDPSENLNISLKKVLTVFDSDDSIFYVHYKGKEDRGITDEEVKVIERMLGDKKYRLLLNAGKLRNCDRYNILTSSDVNNWRNYSTISSDLPELLFDICSFEKFIDILKNNIPFIESEAAGIHKYKCDGGVNVYTGINVIFGNRGSGKTYTLKKIAQSLNSDECIYLNDGEKESNFNSKYLSLDSEERSFAYRKCTNEDNLNDSFKSIKGFKFPKIRSAKNYEQRIANEYRGNLKLIDGKCSSICLMTKETYNILKKIYDDIEDLLCKIDKKSEIFGDYINFDENFKNDLKENFYKINEILQKNAIKCLSKKMTMETIGKFKQIIDSSSKKSTNLETSFFKYAESYISLYKHLLKIFVKLHEIQNHEYSGFKLIGNVHKKGNVYVKTTAGVDLEVKGDDYNGRKNYIKEIINNGSQETISDLQTIWKEKDFNDISKFMFCCKDTYLGSSEEDCRMYQLSNGEKNIIQLDEYLSKDRDFYFLDEPERGLGNYYVTESIIPKLKDLGNKVVVVATHNANIAVTTQPINTIYTEYVGDKEDKHIRYQGNMFNKLLKDVENAENSESWEELSLKILEGGKEAFDERENYYD